MKTIILDCDDSILCLKKSMCKALNDFTGKNIHWNQWHDFDIISQYKMKTNDFYKCIIENNLLENALPFDETKDLLTDLKYAGYNIKVITARSYHVDAQKITEDWFAKYDIPVDTVVVSEHGKKKCDYVNKEENVKLVIDDNIEHCINFIASGKASDVYLYSQPWNINCPLPRIHNLNEVRTLLHL